MTHRPAGPRESEREEQPGRREGGGAAGTVDGHALSLETGSTGRAAAHNFLKKELQERHVFCRACAAKTVAPGGGPPRALVRASLLSSSAMNDKSNVPLGRYGDNFNSKEACWSLVFVLLNI